MRNKSGNIEATRKGIANVFAEFHEDLYSNKNDERKEKQDSEAGPENTCDHADDDKEDDEQDRHIPELTRKELMIAIGSLKKGKSADSKGIKAEDINGIDEEIITMTHEIFNLVIKQNSMDSNS